jgi:hypothetical protein
MVFLLPETSRVLVGNGSIAPTGIHRTLFAILTGQQRIRRPFIGPKDSKIPIPNPLGSVYIIFFRDTASIMLVHSVFYMTYGCTQASMSSLFIDIYGFSKLEAGLSYLPMGFGCVLASYFSGAPTSVG